MRLPQITKCPKKKKKLRVGPDDAARHLPPAARQPARGGAGPRCRPGAGAPARALAALNFSRRVRRGGGDRLGPGELVQRRGDDAAARIALHPVHLINS